MSNLEIRPLTPQDIPHLERIDHSYHTDFVWQMEVNLEEKDITIRFKEVKLPRSMRVEYPKSSDNFTDRLEDCEWTFVAHRDGEPVGYATVAFGNSKALGIISDIVVLRRVRRQGVGSALVLSIQTGLTQQGFNHIQLEMQSKNHPAISLANKLGYEFCGYSDRFYPNQDIALFFGRRL